MITPFFNFAVGGKVVMPGGIDPEPGKRFKVVPYAKRGKDYESVSLTFYGVELNKMPATDLVRAYNLLL